MSAEQVSLRDWVQCHVSQDAPEVVEGSRSGEKAVGVRTLNPLFAAGRRGTSSRETKGVTTAFLIGHLLGISCVQALGLRQEPGKDPSLGTRILGRQMATGE